MGAGTTLLLLVWFKGCLLTALDRLSVHRGGPPQAPVWNEAAGTEEEERV